jgi:SAM-dependent methyltransferase
LHCKSGHKFPVVQGVPVLIRNDVPHTIWMAEASLKLAEQAAEGKRTDAFFVETLGLSPAQRDSVRALAASASPGQFDPVVAYLVSATNGIAYAHLIGNLDRYPIPEIALPTGSGGYLLDIGCSWGRWSIAAARKGYVPVGLDPSLGAVLAAKRLSAQLGTPYFGVVADARHLPFREESFDAVYSYSVLQHFAKADAIQALREAKRVSKAKALLLVQMASAWGVRSFQHQLRRRFREPRGFEVRYWTPAEVKAQFTKLFGAVEVFPDCYFGLGLQKSDMQFMPVSTRTIIRASEALKAVARTVPPIKGLADSLFVKRGF